MTVAQFTQISDSLNAIIVFLAVIACLLVAIFFTRR